MNAKQVIEHLELALIELEYAAADFAHRKASTQAIGAGDLEAMLAKMVGANKALQLALTILEREPKRPPGGRAN